jgi:hypothetical protein
MSRLSQLQRRIEQEVRRGEPFDRIEDDVIEPSGLPEDQKSALWLYAWSFVDRHTQRREARAHIALLDSREIHV